MVPMLSCLLGLPAAVDSLPLSQAFHGPRSAKHDSLPVWAPFFLSWARLFLGGSLACLRGQTGHLSPMWACLCGHLWVLVNTRGSGPGLCFLLFLFCFQMGVLVCSPGWPVSDCSLSPTAGSLPLESGHALALPCFLFSASCLVLAVPVVTGASLTCYTRCWADSALSSVL